MIAYRIRRVSLLVALIAVAAVIVDADRAGAATPVKLTLAGQFGPQVNATEVEAGKGPELEDVCTVASKDVCQQGTGSAATGGFQFAEGVAVAPSGDVYVVDAGNKRIDEFSASGQFVLMFGWDVNKTKVEKGTATQQEMNVCTETEVKAKDECRPGLEGVAPGQFDAPFSITVDASGDVYVAEYVFGSGGLGQRVQKLTPEGQFVLEIGKGVNETNAGNVCTAVEGKCGAPGPYVPEAGSFNFESGFGDLLAVHAGTLYVGDEGRVQEFDDATGAPSGEVPLEAGVHVDALTVDETGDVYLTDGASPDLVREFNPTDSEVQSIEVSPEQFEAVVTIRGLALDAQGHLAVAAYEQPQIGQTAAVGSLYEAGDGERLTAFKVPTGRSVNGIGFGPKGGPNGDLYVATGDSQEILQYAPETVAGLKTGTATCAQGADRETDATFNCTLSGEVRPEGIADTEAQFEWGRGTAADCGLAASTPKKPVSGAETVEAPLEGLRPNETYCYRLGVEDENAKAPEALTSKLAEVTTEPVPPRLVGEPQTQFVKASSAVMYAELNPENAQTKYTFEYAPGANALALCNPPRHECAGVPRLPCSGATQTPLQHSGAYGSIDTAAEVVGLRPSTEYSYLLTAESENALTKAKCFTTSAEGVFTTATVPSPSATTAGVCADAGATSAVISATVTPDGAPVIYSFELGVYDGAATQFGVVFSGSVAPNGGPVEVSFPLTGLQPGTEYAFRIAISSGYIDNQTHTLQGQAGGCLTSGLPSVLESPLVLAQLPAPPIAFPKAAVKPKAKAKKIKAKKPKRGKKAKKGKKGKKARRSALRRAR
jgi:hypothetical protein